MTNRNDSFQAPRRRISSSSASSRKLSSHSSRKTKNDSSSSSRRRKDDRPSKKTEGGSDINIDQLRYEYLKKLLDEDDDITKADLMEVEVEKMKTLSKLKDRSKDRDKDKDSSLKSLSKTMSNLQKENDLLRKKNSKILLSDFKVKAKKNLVKGDYGFQEADGEPASAVQQLMHEERMKKELATKDKVEKFLWNYQSNIAVVEENCVNGLKFYLCENKKKRLYQACIDKVIDKLVDKGKTTKSAKKLYEKVLRTIVDIKRKGEEDIAYTPEFHMAAGAFLSAEDEVQIRQQNAAAKKIQRYVRGENKITKKETNEVYGQNDVKNRHRSRSRSRSRNNLRSRVSRRGSLDTALLQRSLSSSSFNADKSIANSDTVMTPNNLRNHNLRSSSLRRRISRRGALSMSLNQGSYQQPSADGINNNIARAARADYRRRRSSVGVPSTRDSITSSYFGKSNEEEPQDDYESETENGDELSTSERSNTDKLDASCKSVQSNASNASRRSMSSKRSIRSRSIRSNYSMLERAIVGFEKSKENDPANSDTEDDLSASEHSNASEKSSSSRKSTRSSNPSNISISLKRSTRSRPVNRNYAPTEKALERSRSRSLVRRQSKKNFERERSISKTRNLNNSMVLSTNNRPSRRRRASLAV